MFLQVSNGSLESGSMGTGFLTIMQAGFEADLIAAGLPPRQHRSQMLRGASVSADLWLRSVLWKALSQLLSAVEEAKLNQDSAAQLIVAELVTISGCIATMDEKAKKILEAVSHDIASLRTLFEATTRPEEMTVKAVDTALTEVEKYRLKEVKDALVGKEFGDSVLAKARVHVQESALRWHGRCQHGYGIADP